MAEEDQAAAQPDDSGAEETQPSAEQTAPESPKEQQAADALAAAQAALNMLKGDASGSSGERPAGATPQAAPSPAPKPVCEGSSGFDLPSFSLGSSSEIPEGLALLKDVNLDVKIELGRTRMVVDDVLRLSEGAVVELDKLAGDPVDIYVNGRHIARGEVLVLNENFCVRISEILAGAEAAARQIASDALSA